jgi:pyridoxamine 5'-phosphate oxidase
MTLAPWRSPLARALHRNRALANARYVQLATVRPDGRPANRTIVFRGFLDAALQFVIDRRSEKPAQIEHQPWGEICWYFPKTREQFRLLGTLTIVAADHADPALLQARKQIWHDLSESARSQFAWAHPGHPRADAASFTPPQPDPLNPLPQFCLLLFHPAQVDHLELRGAPQNRHLYVKAAEEWEMRSINP